MKRHSLMLHYWVIAAVVISSLLSAPQVRAADIGGFDAALLDAYSMNDNQEIYDSVTYDFLDQYNPTGSWRFFNAGGTDLTTSAPLVIGLPYILIGVAGSGNDAYPFLEIKGECPSAIAVRACELTIGESVYRIDFESSAPEYAVCQVFKTEENVSRLNLYVPMGNAGIDLLSDLYAARFAFSCRVFYNMENTVTLSSAGYSDEHYAFNWVYRGLMDAGYLDGEGNADAVVKLLTLDAMDNNTAVPVVTGAAANLPETSKAPSAIAYIEPAYAIIFTYYGDSGMLDDGTPWFADEVVNISAFKTVTGYTIAYYCADANGDQLQPVGGGDTIQYRNIEETILPGKTISVPAISADGYENVKSVHTAISRIVYEDGTTVNIPDRLWKYCTWVYE
jgi:hypothetical protein